MDKNNSEQGLLGASMEKIMLFFIHVGNKLCLWHLYW